MRVEDKVYGVVEICDPVLLDLLSAPSVLRLHGIQQYGIPWEYHRTSGFTRHEHSVGVMILLKKLGAGVAEQAAGLLHDVSHTAFSHVTDYVWNDEQAQDERHRSFLLASELPALLGRHGISAEHIADISAHPLLEREVPDLCADRVDYTLRELAGGPREYMVPGYLDGLMVVDNKIVFSDFVLAKDFARDFLFLHSFKWAGVEKTVRQHIFAEALRAALASGTLSVADLFEDDEHALRILRASKDPKVIALLGILACGLTLEADAEQPDLVLERRQRFIDPEFIHGTGLRRVSDASPLYKKMVELQRRLHNKGVRVKITKEPCRAVA